MRIFLSQPGWPRYPLGVILDIAIERIDRTVDAPKRQGIQAAPAHTWRVHKDDALGYGFIGRAKTVGRFDDHNFAVQWLDAVAAKQFGIYGHGGALGDKHAHGADFQHTVFPMHVSIPVL
jgi:hypothetical protein